MDITFATGLIGSLILITGAAWPETKVKKAWQSVKNWLLGGGGLVMLLYAILQYVEGGSVFFVFLEVLVVVASIFMMFDTSDILDSTVIIALGIGFIIWSLYLFEGYNTIFFIIGLSAIGLGYAFEMGSIRRILALTLGGALIALFSYIEASWIFFWLNLFFAIFSGYYLTKALLEKAHPKKRFFFF